MSHFTIQYFQQNLSKFLWSKIVASRLFKLNNFKTTVKICSDLHEMYGMAIQHYNNVLVIAYAKLVKQKIPI